MIGRTRATIITDRLAVQVKIICPFASIQAHGCIALVTQFADVKGAEGVRRIMQLIHANGLW
jgi:hypothetical protein